LALLLIVHALLFLPLVEQHETPLSGISITQLYAVNGVLSAVLHIANCVLSFNRGELQNIYRVIGEKSAMSSVGWDVIFCAIIGVIGTRRITSIFLPIAISLGGTMGGMLFMASGDEIKDKSN
jgi:hypothetical protein